MSLRIVHVVTGNGVEFTFEFFVLPDGVRFEFDESPPLFELRGDDLSEERPV